MRYFVRYFLYFLVISVNNNILYYVSQLKIIQSGIGFCGKRA